MLFELACGQILPKMHVAPGNRLLRRESSARGWVVHPLGWAAGCVWGGGRPELDSYLGMGMLLPQLPFTKNFRVGKNDIY